MSKNKLKPKSKMTQAERMVLNWTGVEPDGKEATQKPTDRKSVKQILHILTNGIYAANPELAFGIVRRLLTGNVLKAKHFDEFISRHPVFNQLGLRALNGEGQIYDVDGALLEEAKDSKWGQENKVLRTLEVVGEVSISWVDKDGVKTEKTLLGFEMITYETDSRPFIALNCGGGSAARHFLLKSGPKPDYKINNDADSRRYVKKGTTVEKTLQAEEKEAESEADSIVAQILAGETVRLGNF